MRCISPANMLYADQLDDFSVSSFAPSSAVPSLFEFIKRFSENGGFDPDEITEFIAGIETISGISVELTSFELSFKFTLDTDASQHSKWNCRPMP